MLVMELVSDVDTINLNQLLTHGRGIQVLSGVFGLGLPNVQPQWLEGAGDGATFRGQRVLPREIDLPLFMDGIDREGLKALVRRLSLMLAGEMRLIVTDLTTGESWFTVCHRVGGGQPVYGPDTTGEGTLNMVVTLRAGDPYWTAVRAVKHTLASGASGGLLPNLTSMSVRSSQVMGKIRINNPGSVEAYPTWVLTGPGKNFTATSAKGEKLRWVGDIGGGEKVFIDCRNGTVFDSGGTNRYAHLAAAPRFWTLPPGSSTHSVSMEDTTGASRIEVEYHPRNWMVV